MFYRLWFCLALVICLAACTKQAPSSVLAASEKGAGEAEAIHGGDLVDLKLRAARELYREVAENIQSARNIESLGVPLHSCVEFPFPAVCEALKVPVGEREEARRFLLRNLRELVALIQSSRLKLIPSNLSPTQPNADGSARSVLAWTKLKSDGSIEIYFQEKVRDLGNLQLLALLSHEMGHAISDPVLGRVTDNMAVALPGLSSADGRYLLDLAAAELTVYAYEAILKLDPNTLNGMGRGFLASRNVMKHGASFANQSTYADFNGDGRSDLMFVGVDNELYFSGFNGVGFNLPAVVGQFSGSFSPGHFHFVKLNDDRRSDVLFRGDDNSITACYGGETALVGCHQALQLPGIFSDGDLLTGDFDGDSLADLAYREKSNFLRIYRYDGSQFRVVTSFALSGDYAGSRLTVANVTSDTDGLIREDLMYHDSGNDFWLYTSRGNGFDSRRWVMHHGYSASEGIELYADFNGDGLKDLIFLGGDNRLWLNVSDGEKLGAVAEVGNLGMDGSSARLLLTGDFNGDGKADLLFGRPVGSSTHFEVLYSSQQGLTQRSAFDVPFVVATGQLQISDVDGDGRSDVMIQTLDSTFELKISVEGR